MNNSTFLQKIKTLGFLYQLISAVLMCAGNCVPLSPMISSSGSAVVYLHQESEIHSFRFTRLIQVIQIRGSTRIPGSRGGDRWYCRGRGRNLKRKESAVGCFCISLWWVLLKTCCIVNLPLLQETDFSLSSL